MSFKFTYKAVPYPDAALFSALFVEHDYSNDCAINGFMSVDNLLNVNNVSLTSDCLGLRIGQLELPDTFRYIVYFPGLTPQQETDPGTSIVIHSKLKSPKGNLGNFFKVVSDDPDMTVLELIFSSKTPQFSGIIRNVNVSIFDSEVSTEMIINSPWISFRGSTTIFYQYDIMFSGESSTDDSMYIDISAEIIDGANGFRTNAIDYLNSHIRSEINSVLERRRNTQESINSTAIMTKKLETELNEKQIEYADLLQQYEQANTTFTYWKRKMAETKEAFEETTEEYENAQGNSLSLDDICTETECAYLCQHGISCSTCYSPSRLEESGICETIVNGYRTVIRYREISVIGWRYELRCKPCLTFRWFLIFYISVGGCCTTTCVPFTDYRQEYYNSKEPYTKIIEEPCTTNVYEQPVSGECCMEYPCSERVQNLSCLINNLECQEKMQEALANLEISLSLKYKAYSDAKANFTISEVEMTRIYTKLQAVDQEYQIIDNALQSTYINLNIKKEAKEKVLQETEFFDPILHAVGGLSDSENIVDIKNVTFTTVLTTSTPIAFPVNFIYEYAGQSYEINIIINFDRPKEFIYRRLSQAILEDILGRDVSSRKRQTVQYNENVSHTCINTANIESYIQQISASLNESSQQFENTKNSFFDVLNNSSVNYNNFTNQQQNLEFFSMLVDSYTQLTNDKSSSITKLLETLDENSFPRWQTNMEMVHINGSDIGGFSCVSFIDCLQSAFDALFFIIQDTPLPQAKSIEQTLTAAKESFLGLGYNESYTFHQAQTILSQVMEVLSDLKGLEYWCSDPPQIIEQPPAEVNMSIGDTLELSCKASSNLPVQYHWRRNSMLLSSRSNTLSVQNIQRSEGGNYSCSVTSDSGIATSLLTIVNVYYQPILNLSLVNSVETFEGYDNGLSLACDAHSWPPPGWKWFYRAMNMDEWTDIVDVDANVLSLEPKLSDEGWYTCMAYNWIGNVSSEPTYLTVLPASVARIEYPISIRFTPDFDISLAAGKDFNRSDYKQMVADTIHNSLQVKSTQIQDVELIISDNNFNITVSFKLMTPHVQYIAYDSIQEVFSKVGLLVIQLQLDRNNLISLASEDGGIVMSISGLNFHSVENSLSISPRVFVCPNGYQVDSSLVICG